MSTDLNLFKLTKSLPDCESRDWNVVIIDATEIPIPNLKIEEVL